MPAQGPYRFLRYKSKGKKTAVIVNPRTGAKVDCTTAHLQPYYGKLGEVEIAADEVVGTRPTKRRKRDRGDG